MRGRRDRCTGSSDDDEMTQYRTFTCRGRAVYAHSTVQFDDGSNRSIFRRRKITTMCTSIATMSSRVHIDFSTSISLAPTDNGSVNVDGNTRVVDVKFDLAKHFKMRSTTSRDLSGLSKELLVVVLVVVVVVALQIELLLLLPLPEGRLFPSCVRILRLLIYTVSQQRPTSRTYRLHDS